MPARTARSIGRISLGLFLSAQFAKEADGQQHIHDTQKRTEVMSLLDQIIRGGAGKDSDARLRSKDLISAFLIDECRAVAPVRTARPPRRC